MIDEIVTVQAGNAALSGWKRVSIEYGARQAARSFHLDASEGVDVDAFGLPIIPHPTYPTPSPAQLSQLMAQAWQLAPGTPVEIMANADLAVRGYIDNYRPSYGATTHEVSVDGRSKGADAVDSSAIHESGKFSNQNLLDIAKQLDASEVRYSSTENLRRLSKHQLQPGETVFQSLERRARHEKLLMVGKADGSIAFEKAGSKRAGGALIEGWNILRASANLGMAGRHSKVHVRGQKAHGKGAASLRVEKTYEDKAVKRNRPLIVLHEGEADDDSAQARAEWHVKRAQGWSITAEVVVQGWRDDAGALWEGNTLIAIHSPLLKLDQDMLIDKVTLIQSVQEGTVATLSLVDPRALGGKDGGGKSNSVWGGQ